MVGHRRVSCMIVVVWLGLVRSPWSVSSLWTVCHSLRQTYRSRCLELEKFGNASAVDLKVCVVRVLRPPLRRRSSLKSSMIACASPSKCTTWRRRIRRSRTCVGFMAMQASPNPASVERTPGRMQEQTHLSRPMWNLSPWRVTFV